MERTGAPGAVVSRRVQLEWALVVSLVLARARLASSDVVVEREVQGGPGPSIVDLPAAGCWRFDLTWSGHADRLYIPYQPAAAGVAG